MICRIVIDNCWLADKLAPLIGSTAWTVKVNVPPAVGVPPMVVLDPGPAFSEMPGGGLPAVIDHCVALLPVDPIVAEYAWPADPDGSELVVIWSWQYAAGASARIATTRLRARHNTVHHSKTLPLV